VGVALALGAAAAATGVVFGMPGKGEFVPLIWLAGFLATVAAPGWAGFAALMVGAIVMSTVLDASDGVLGLVVLIVAVVAALAAHGALSAAVLLRLRAEGWRGLLRDRVFAAGAAAALGLVLVFAWIANDFARNPP